MFQINGSLYKLERVVDVDEVETDPTISITIQEDSSTCTHRINLKEDGNKRANSKGDTWLHLACSKGITTALTGFIQYGGKKLNLEERDSNDDTPLMLAIQNGNQKNIEALIEAGADIHAYKTRELPGWSVLHTAVRVGDITTLKLLLERGVKPTTCSFSRWNGDKWEVYENGNALLLAVSSSAIPEKKKEMVDLLLKAGDDPHQVYGDQANVLTYTMSNAGKKDEDLVALFLNLKVNPNQVNKDGKTPLNYIRQASVGVVQLLLEHGAKVDVRDNQGRTPLQETVYDNNAEVAELLISKGASSELLTNGVDLLRTACCVVHLKIIKCLLNHGVDPNEKRFGENLFICFSEKLYQNCTRQDISGAEVLEVIQLFLSKGAKVDLKAKKHFDSYLAIKNFPEIKKLVEDDYNSNNSCVVS